MLIPTPVVLYVEDEENDRLFMEIAFAKEGLAEVLRTVNHGRAAIEYLAGRGIYAERDKHPVPCMVLLDLNLPEVHGFDVLKWIRSHPVHSKLPVVVFSSSLREEDRTRARLLGASDFVQKPSSPARFREVVLNLHQQGLGHRA